MSAAATAERQRVLEDMFSRPADSELTVTQANDIVRQVLERAAHAPTISALAAKDVHQALAAAEALHEASIKLTHPEDWVTFKAKDGPDLCYLQDAGCQRIRGLWAISFDKFDLRDFVEHKLDDGHVMFEVSLSGRCGLTGEENMEIGTRTSSGFFGPAWEKSKDRPVERELVRSNVRKAALANAEGRLVRRFAGMAAVPKAFLAKHLDVSRIRGADFQSGTQGGSGDYASQPQINLIAAEALKQKKVAGLEQVIDYPGLVKKLAEAAIPKSKASRVIERLKAAEQGSLTVADFEEGVGITLVAGDAGGSAE